MNEASQSIAAARREAQLAEWQRQIQSRQEHGITIDEWVYKSGVSIGKGAYYHRL